MATLVWLRRNLRISDNPALEFAVKRGQPVLPMFIWAPAEEDPWSRGAASRIWLHESLAALERQFERLGSRLMLLHGPSLNALVRMVQDTGADTVVWDRGYEPAGARRDVRIKYALEDFGVSVNIVNAGLLGEPEGLKNLQGKPYQVFTPYHRRYLQSYEHHAPLPEPKAIPAPPLWPESFELEHLGLIPGKDWAAKIRKRWTPGADAAAERLHRFIQDDAAHYERARDFPGDDMTSTLSAHLHFGEISPRQVWHKLDAARQSASPGARASIESYRRQLVWREFAYALLHHFPNTSDKPLRIPFDHFPWRNDATALKAWQRGRTGYPIVDAGMRQLWATGWMHNRVRMIVASFLTKHLLIDWREGARWFWDTLVDADLANNTFGWQWTAGCGADAAPYFRVFNPIQQGRKFDPDGNYVRRWIPRLGKVPAKWIHAPWEAPGSALLSAGVSLGKNYPRPIVDHPAARERALKAYASITSRHKTAAK